MALPSSDVAQPPLSLMDYRSLLSGAASDQYQQKVEKLVSKLTSQNATALDMELVKQLKQSLKVSEKRVAYAFDLLFEQLKYNHSQKRLMALQLFDVLYMRSKALRDKMDKHLQAFLELTIAFSIDTTLPPPRTAAAQLRTQSLGVLRKWAKTYGSRHRQVAVAYRYLSEQLRLEFPPEDATTEDVPSRRGREERERQRRTQEILRDSFERLKTNFDEDYRGLLTVLQEIKSCLEMLSVSSHKAMAVDDDIEWEEEGDEHVAQPSPVDGSLAKRDLNAVEESLGEAYKIIVLRGLPTASEWLSILSRVQLAPHDQVVRDEMLRKVVSLRERIQTTKSECEARGVLTNTRRSMRKAEHQPTYMQLSSETDTPTDKTKHQDELTKTQRLVDPTYAGPTISMHATKDSQKVKNEEKRNFDNPQASITIKEETTDENVDEATKAKKRKLKELLAVAPKVKNSRWVQDWGHEQPVTISGWVSRGMEIDGHWGRIEGDNLTLPASSLDQLGAHAVFFDSLDDKKPGDPQNEIMKEKLALDKSNRQTKKTRKAEQPTTSNQKGDRSGNAVDKSSTDLRRQARQTRRQEDRAHFESVLRDVGMAYEERREDPSVTAEERHLLQEAIKIMEKDEKEQAKKSKKIKERPPVRDRLARKVLTGANSWATAQCVENERDLKYRERFANEWEAK